MLSKADNELIGRVGPDAPMGKAFRHYWLPVMLSSELPEPDSVPFPVEVCGERLVVFRDTKGALGALAEHCCHRGASLLLGRVEECGIRCIYHGWKFADRKSVVEGKSVSVRVDLGGRRIIKKKNKNDSTSEQKNIRR